MGALRAAPVRPLSMNWSMEACLTWDQERTVDPRKKSDTRPLLGATATAETTIWHYTVYPYLLGMLIAH
jgi:hypothetical protein